MFSLTVVIGRVFVVGASSKFTEETPYGKLALIGSIANEALSF